MSVADDDDDLDHDPRGTMTDEEWRYFKARFSPDFPRHFGAPIGEKRSPERDEWVRSSVLTHTRVGREARLRELERGVQGVTARERLAELEERVARFH